ncbi:large conductance mechanosensitive channel protein MscL [Pedobacter mucosus]|uniref:large conductance mechanosensitive channel protein MscL n=1 Tax=Pedobacter mucosus TaxID=2895286 RepID=UPI001EE42234|nr:large conductance mechanosensitive channel protein MscL [Pedobacter mucosus]UKT65121.1 large conductance mechanosensitive channel protein MscL [Pedobacter mucosus]
MGIVKEFKDFAIKGNVIDLAVGVIIGAAFGKIVSSLVEDIITPALLGPALKAAGLEDLSKLTIAGTAIKYGNFLSQVISFIIVAFILFVIIRTVNKLKSKEIPPVVVPVITKEETLLTEIRDLLKARV